MISRLRSLATATRHLGWAALGCLVAVLVVIVAPSLAVAGPFGAKPEPSNERATPRRSVEGFLRAGRSGDFGHAAGFLDLRGLSTQRRSIEGPTLAKDLLTVIDRRLPIDLTKVSDDPEGDSGDGAGADVVGSISLDDEAIPLQLTRSKTDGGSQVWLVSRATVAMIPALRDAYGDHWISEHLPASITRPRFLGVALFQWMALALVVMVASWLGQALSAMVASVFDRLAKRTSIAWDDALAKASRGPLRWVIAAVLMKVMAAPIHLHVVAELWVERATTTLLIFGLASYVIRVLHSAAEALEARLPEDTAGELKSRGVRTQLEVARRIAGLLVGFLAFGVVLLQFEFVRNIGMSLLASAGIASVVLGFAAQKSLGGIVAGIQISITQPLRIGDLVVMELETGIVEQINLTFVVVRLLDDRRLIVPIARVLDLPFQNWTKMGSALLGAVIIQVDSMTPVAKVREELTRLCTDHRLWDKRLATLQVMELGERSMTLRATISVARVEDLFDLRAEVREGLLTFLQNLEGGVFLGRRPPPP